MLSSAKLSKYKPDKQWEQRGEDDAEYREEKIMKISISPAFFSISISNIFQYRNSPVLKKLKNSQQV